MKCADVTWLADRSKRRLARFEGEWLHVCVHACLHACLHARLYACCDDVRKVAENAATNIYSPIIYGV